MPFPRAGPLILLFSYLLRVIGTGLTRSRHCDGSNTRVLHLGRSRNRE